MDKQRTRKVEISSVSRALRLIGDRWTVLILQEAFRGADRFEDLREGASATRRTLASRLRGLVANGLMEQRTPDGGGAHRRYYLTEMGRDLFDWMLLVWSWGIRWNVVAPNGPRSLTHTVCGMTMLPNLVCEHCNGPVSLRACRYEAGAGAGEEEVLVSRLHRRRHPGGKEAPRVLDVVDMMTDRWTAEVISSQYYGIHRFEDIQQRLDVASNILTDRLKALVENEILERQPYNGNPPRYEYWMTAKGKDLFPHTVLALLIWGDKWVVPEGQPLRVIHRQCGQTLKAKLICSECDGELGRDCVVEHRGHAAETE